QFLNGTKEIAVPKERRKPNGNSITVVGATHNNLKNVTVAFPLGVFTVITGVSGSGKSSLVHDILKFGMRNSERGMEQDEEENGEETDDAILDPRPSILQSFDRIDGTEHVDKVIDIDQAPIGRTPRSNPATYIKVWDEIRWLYSQMAEAKARG